MIPYAVALPGGFTAGDDPARLDMEAVHAALADAYWAAGRRRDLAERAFARSLALGVFAPGGATVGFGRIVTDFTFRAHVADVMVLPAARGRGLGRALVAAMLGHPELATVTTWTLTTRDAHGLYAGFGFRASPGDPDWMGAPPRGAPRNGRDRTAAVTHAPRGRRPREAGAREAGSPVRSCSRPPWRRSRTS